jgi:hypothetical protein
MRLKKENGMDKECSTNGEGECRSVSVEVQKERDH